MAALESKHKMMIKKNKSKLLSLKYSSQIYTEYKVIKADDFVKERYLLRDSNEVEIINLYSLRSTTLTGNLVPSTRDSYDITLLTELKLNNPNAIRQAKLFLES